MAPWRFGTRKPTEESESEAAPKSEPQGSSDGKQTGRDVIGILTGNIEQLKKKIEQAKHNKAYLSGELSRLQEILLSKQELLRDLQDIHKKREQAQVSQVNGFKVLTAALVATAGALVSALFNASQSAWIAFIITLAPLLLSLYIWIKALLDGRKLDNHLKETESKMDSWSEVYFANQRMLAMKADMEAGNVTVPFDALFLETEKGKAKPTARSRGGQVVYETVTSFSAGLMGSNISIEVSPSEAHQQSSQQLEQEETRIGDALLEFKEAYQRYQLTAPAEPEAATSNQSNQSQPRPPVDQPPPPAKGSLSRVRTKGDGQCAFHAIFGRWLTTEQAFGLLDSEAQQKRQEFVDRLRQLLNDPKAPLQSLDTFHASLLTYIEDQSVVLNSQQPLGKKREQYRQLVAHGLQLDKNMNDLLSKANLPSLERLAKLPPPSAPASHVAAPQPEAAPGNDATLVVLTEALSGASRRQPEQDAVLEAYKAYRTERDKSDQAKLGFEQQVKTDAALREAYFTALALKEAYLSHSDLYLLATLFKVEFLLWIPAETHRPSESFPDDGSPLKEADLKKIQIVHNGSNHYERIVTTEEVRKLKMYRTRLNSSRRAM